MLNWLVYGGIVLLTFIFTYIFEIKENFLILYMLIFAPIIDFVLFSYYKGKIYINTLTTDDCLEKGQDFTCVVEIANQGMLPIVFLDYEFSFNGKFHCNYSPRERISISPKKIIIREFHVDAIHRGEGQVNLDDVEIKSVMGLFTKKLDFNHSTNTITITPALVEVEGVDKLIECTMSMIDDDETSNNMFIGEPGYEFKEYSPGEPLNRVNWKLSSKIGKLMIRKSATDVKRKKIMIIDPVIVNTAKFEDYGDLLIEGMIGTVREFYNADYTVDIYYAEQKGWGIFKFENIDSIPILQQKFSSYNFKEGRYLANRFNNFNNMEDENCDYVIFTTNKDVELQKLVLLIESQGNSTHIISNNKENLFESEFLLNEDYSLERI